MLAISGTVTAVRSPLVYADLFGGAVGSFVRVYPRISGRAPMSARIVAFEGERCFLSPLGSLDEVAVGDKVELLSTKATVTLPLSPLGCVFDAEGRVLSNQNPSTLEHGKSLDLAERSSSAMRHESDACVELNCFAAAPGPMERSCEFRWFPTGTAAIDSLLPLWTGQRLAVLAEPGVGKTTLLRALAVRNPNTLTVVALIGERGIEVNQFVEELRQEGGMKNSVIVASTSDEPPLRRSLAAYTAVAIAEYLAASGRHVQLLFDSMTRFARSLREIGLASGEAPVRRGYPASVFRQLPELIERTGPLRRGSITAFFTVLKSGTIDEDPISEEICSLTDGHISLSKALADSGVYPAIDVVNSLSRNSERITGKREREQIRLIRSALSTAAEEEDLLRMGGVPLFESTSHVIQNRFEIQRLLSDRGDEDGQTGSWEQRIGAIRSRLIELVAPMH